MTWQSFLRIVLALALLERASQARVRTLSSDTRKTLWACATDVVVLCSDVVPGDGRMEACLKRKKSFLTSMCANQRRTSDPLPPVCEKDAAIHCPGETEDALQLMCLRKHRNRLTANCWKRLSQLQSDGWELLHSRFKMLGVDTPCTQALLDVCKDIAPGYGALRMCVDNNWRKLELQCGLKKREDPESIPEACESDALEFCKHVVKGDGRMLSCLQAYEADSRLSADCRSAILLQAAGLETVCAPDVTKYCVRGEHTRSQLVNCLHEHQEKLVPGCTTRKHKYTPEERGTSFRNLHTGDHAHGCVNDIKKFCKGIKPGHGLIHKCLMEHRDKVSPECKIPIGQVVPRGSLGMEDQRRVMLSRPDYLQVCRTFAIRCDLSFMLLFFLFDVGGIFCTLFFWLL
jgi:Golgi apparatus protein 1